MLDNLPYIINGLNIDNNTILTSNGLNINVRYLPEFNNLCREIKAAEDNCKKISTITELKMIRDFISKKIPETYLFVNTFGSHKNPFLTDLELKVTNYELFLMSEDMVRDIAISPYGFLLQLLCMINSTCFGKVKIICKDGWAESSVLMVILFASSGTQKSVACERLQKPFKHFEKIVNTHNLNLNGSMLSKAKNKIEDKVVKEIVNSLDFNSPGIIMYINKCLQKANDAKSILSEQRWLINDCTQFGLLNGLYKNRESQIISNPEGRFLVNLVKNHNLELILKAYGQEKYDYQKGNREIHLSHPASYMSVFAQHDIADLIYSYHYANQSGLTARLLPFYQQSANKNLSFNSQGGSAASVYFDRMLKLLNFFRNNLGNDRLYEIKLDNEAQEYIENFSEQCNCCISSDQYYKQWLSKLAGQAVRLAFAKHIWHHFDNPLSTSISRDEIDFGITVAQVAVPSAEFLLSSKGLKVVKNAERIIASLQRIATPNERQKFITYGTNTTAIAQRTGISKNDVNDALYLLTAKNWVAIYDDGYGVLSVLPHFNFFSNFVSEI